MMFESRQEAGERLGRHLAAQPLEVDGVLGLPRGGVVVAAAVARWLHCPLDVVVVRKIGHPLDREFAVGALAEGDAMLLDHDSLDGVDLQSPEMQALMAEARARLLEYQQKFHPHHRFDWRNKTLLLADDGLATGATVEVAVMAVRRQGARRIWVAAPVASDTAVARLERVAERVLALCADPAFGAVGQYYRDFEQTSDEEVLALLK
jgi:predicted phosphoribosyltransferase